MHNVCPRFSPHWLSSSRGAALLSSLVLFVFLGLATPSSQAQVVTNILGFAKITDAVMESEGATAFTVTRKQGTRGRILVDVAVPTVANPGSTNLTGWTNTVVEMLDYQLSAKFAVTIQNNTSTNANQPVKFTLSNPRVAPGEDPVFTPILQAASTNMTLTVQDEDAALIFSFEKVNNSANEGSRMNIRVLLAQTPTASGAQNVSVEYTIGAITSSELAPGAAFGNYTDSGTLTFGDNQNFQDIAVTVPDDGVLQFDREFKVTLSNPRGEPAANNTNTVTYSVSPQSWARGRLFFNPNGPFPAGSVDQAFNLENVPPNRLQNPGALGPVSVVLVDDQNRTYVGGSFRSVNGDSRSGITRLLPDGNNDPTFTPSGVNGAGAVNAIQIYTDAASPHFGKVVLGGTFTSINGSQYNSVARLLPNGSIDSTFQIGQGLDGPVAAVGLESNGNVIVGGEFLNANGTARGGLARLLPNGQLDLNSFQAISFDGPVLSVLVQPTTVVPVAFSESETNGTPGTFTYPHTVVGSSGSLRLTYNTFADPDRIRVLTGTTVIFNQLLTNNFSVVTDPATGEMTTNWIPATVTVPLPSIPGGNNNVTVTVQQPAGSTEPATFSLDGVITPAGGTLSITVAGDFRSVNGVPARGLARFNAAGAFDPSFAANIGGGADGAVTSMARQSDGKLVIGGAFRNFNNVPRGGITRLDVDGTPDLTFASGIGADGTILSLAIDTQTLTDSIYAAGEFTTFNGTRRRFLTRLFPNGHVDTSFFDSSYNQFVGFPNVNGLAGSGPEGYLSSVSLTPQGDVLVGGLFNLVGGGPSRVATKPRLNFARLLGGSTPGPGNIQASVPSSGVPENGGVKPVNYDRTGGDLGEAIAVLRTLDGAALAGSDYQPLNNFQLVYGLAGTDPIVGQAGSRSANVTIVDDGPPPEGDEDFLVDILNVVGRIDLGGEIIRPDVAFGPLLRTQVIILENDVVPTFIGFARKEYDVDENDGVAVVEVYRTGDATARVTVDYQVVRYLGTNGPAATPTTNNAAGIPVLGDFQTVTNTLEFRAGITNRTFTVTINDDKDREFDEIIQLRLARATGGGVLDTNANTALLNLIDNDLESGKLNFTSSAYSVSEGQPFVEVEVRRAGGVRGFLSVTYRTIDGSNADTNLNAIAGFDYTATNNILEWNDQDASTRKIRIPILNNFIVETNKTFTVLLESPTPEIIGNLRNPTTVTINDDDFFGELSFSAADYFADEDGLNAVIQVVRRGGNAGEVSVSYAATAGTATNGVDFVAVNGVLTFAPGQTATNFVVEILDDTDLPPAQREDGNRTVNLALSAPDTATLGALKNAKLTIIDNEASNIPAGDVEKNFATDSGANGRVNAVALQQDGPTNALRKIIVAGEFTEYNRTPRERVVRLSEDGIVDLRYADNLLINAPVRTILATPDGKLVIGGDFSNVDGVPVNHIARLNTVGHLDSLFDIGAGTDGPVNALAQTFVRSGTNRLSRIVVGGGFTVINSLPRPRIALVGDDGRVDPVFNPGSGPNAPVTAVAAQRDGRILIAGSFTQVAGSVRRGIARLNLDGSVDSTFLPGLGVSGGVATTIVIDQGDKILLGGTFTNVAGATRRGVARLNADGSLDTAFDPGTGASAPVNGLALQADGGLVVVGSFTNFNGITSPRITRLLPSGQVDLNINFGSGANASIAAVASQYDRKIVIGGDFTVVNGFPRSRLARLFGGSIQGGTRIEFSLADYDILESAGLAVVTVQRYGSAEAAATIDYSTVPETAVPGEDYENQSGTLSFGPGETVREIRIPIFDDNLAEPAKSVLVTLTNVTGTNVVIGRQPIARVRIFSDDAQFSFSRANFVVNEGVSEQFASISVIREGDLSFTSTVIVSVTDGTANNGVDYTGGSVQLVFTPGEPIKTFTVPILDDLIGEGDETVFLSLTTSLGRAWPGLANAVLTIEDNDFHPGYFTFTTPTLNVTETSGTVSINVRRTSGAQGAASVRVATVYGAASPADVIGFNDVLSFAHGQTNATFTITVLNDKLVESPEIVSLVLTNATGGAQLGSNPRLDVVIADDDEGPGSLDQSFRDPVVNGTVHSILLQPDGKIAIGGEFGLVNGFTVPRLARLLPDGSRDANFSSGSGPNNTVYSLAPARDGRITVGGAFRVFNGNDFLYVTRVSTNGAVDPSISQSAGINAPVWALGSRPLDTKFLVGGQFTTPSQHLLQMNASGSLDVSFNTGSGVDGDVLDAQYTVDGKTNAFIVGAFQNVDGIRRPGVARLLPDGHIDLSFNLAETITGLIRRVLPLPGGKSLLAGDFSLRSGSTTVASMLVRLNADGSIDTNFVATVNGPVTALARHGDRLFIAGAFTTVNGAPRNLVARLLPDGALDPSFDPTLTVNGAILDLEVQDDLKIIIAGEFTTVNGFPRRHVARLNGMDLPPDEILITATTLEVGSLVVSFASEPGLTYELIGTADLTVPVAAWAVVQTGLVAAGSTSQFSVPATDEYRFFLVRSVTP